MFAFACLTATAQLNGCSTNRPGWADHRSLYVPSSFASANNATTNTWVDALCCVYTWTFSSPSITTPYLITYAGGQRTYNSVGSMEEAGQAAYDDVCSMSMGSNDCSTNAQCVLDALGLAHDESDISIDREESDSTSLALACGLGVPAALLLLAAAALVLRHGQRRRQLADFATAGASSQQVLPAPTKTAGLAPSGEVVPPAPLAGDVTDRTPV